MIDLYVRLLRQFPLYAEPGWHDAAPTPYFGDGSAGEIGLRSSGSFVFTAALLAGPIGTEIGISDADREKLRERAAKNIAYMAAAHRTGQGQCAHGGKWGLEWQSSWWAARMGLGVALLGDALDAETRSAALTLLVAEADRQLGRTPPSGLARDTKAEENAWDCEVIATAMALCPTHDHAPAWREKLSEFAMNSLSTAADRTDDRLVDGKAVRDWNCTVNLHPNLKLENHGAYHFCYIASPLHSLVWSSYALLSAGLPPVEALSHNVRALWEDCLPSFLDNRFAYVSGQDWARYTYGTYFMQPVLALLHGRDGDARAAFVAQQRLERLALEQTANGDGSFFGRRVTRKQMSGQPLKYETDCYANVALAYLLHRHYRPQTAPMAAPQFYESLRRTQINHETLTALTRSPDCFISFSWSSLYTPEPIALFAPNGSDDDIEWSPANLVGQVRPYGRWSEPLYIQSMRETAGGFRIKGEEILATYSNGRILQRLIDLDADSERRRLEIRSKVSALKKCWIRQSEGISLFLPNDLFNEDVRSIVSDTGQIMLHKPPRQSPKGRFGRLKARIMRELGRHETLRHCGNRWINIDDRIGLILLSAEPGLWISEGPANSGPDCLFCHRIVTPRTRRWFRAQRGETLIDTHIMVMAGTAEETRAAAEDITRTN